MKKGSNQRLGKWGENLAAEYLEQKGFQILARNYRTSYGEIDLIASKQGVTVFVEVKTRSGRGFGLPEEAVTPSKQQHLMEAIQAYWQVIGEEGSWQVDVIAVMRMQGGKDVEIEHFENAIH
jgi:putative endonuclease